MQGFCSLKRQLCGTFKTVNENYDIQALEKIENKMAKDKKSANLSNVVFGSTIVLMIFLFIIIVVKTNKHKNKGRIKKHDIQYFKDILDGCDIGEYSVILDWNVGYLNPNVLIATILDLSNKQYLVMDAQKKLKNGLFDNVEYNYYFKINKNKSFEKLTKYEINVINLIFKYSLGDTINIEEFVAEKIELNESLKQIGKDYNYTNKYTKFLQELNKQKVEKMYIKDSGGIWKTFAFMLIVIIALILGNIFILNPMTFENKAYQLVVGIVFTMIFFIGSAICIYYSSRILKTEYIQIDTKLEGLKKYLKDYSKIKDRYPIEIHLWDRYLVFATLFGIADKVAKEFKEELIKNGYDDNYIYSTYPIMCISHDYAAISSSVATSTGTSSSGGYSGGGSGGGGRWRPAVVALFKKALELELKQGERYMKKFKIMCKILRITGVDKLIYVFGIYILISSIILKAVEPAFTSIWDGIWYCFVTFTTVGFGDLVVTTLIGKIISIILMIYGVVIVAFITGTLVNFYQEILKVKTNENISTFLDKLEKLPELSKEELTEISNLIKKRKYKI
ncbi:MAG: DUF2207 domain-containing protein [Clostridia bacterium]